MAQIDSQAFLKEMSDMYTRAGWQKNEVHFSLLDLDMNLQQFERPNKYRWHDLRSNPDDLPDENERVLVCYKFWDSYLSYKVANFHNGIKYTCFYPDGNSLIDIKYAVAWKRFEEFVGEE